MATQSQKTHDDNLGGKELPTHQAYNPHFLAPLLS